MIGKDTVRQIYWPFPNDKSHINKTSNIEENHPSAGDKTLERKVINNEANVKNNGVNSEKEELIQDNAAIGIEPEKEISTKRIINDAKEKNSFQISLSQASPQETLQIITSNFDQQTMTNDFGSPIFTTSTKTEEYDIFEKSGHNSEWEHLENIQNLKEKSHPRTRYRSYD